MTRHLLTLIWNRRRTNLLVMGEILCSFLVLFGVATLGLQHLANYRGPVGYAWQDVWRIAMTTDASVLETSSAARRETLRRLLMAMEELPEVAAAAGTFMTPYDKGGWTSMYSAGGREYRYGMNSVTDEFREVMGLEMLQGRWFSAADDGAAFRPVVINERFALGVFGGGDVVGRSVPQDDDHQGRPRREMRVVGVVREFRQRGEFSAPEEFLFHRTRLEDPQGGRLPPRLIIRVRPGTGGAFEERLVRRLQEVARDWSFKVERLDELRAANHREHLAPLIAVGTVAGFLLLMVALGLTGVLWQNVTQRTREIGLRRAKGATAVRIHRQVLGEVVVMTSLALAAGVLIVVQLPLLDLLGFMGRGVFAASLAVSALALYVLTVLCGFYPARLATRVQPAEALHYE